MSPERGKVIIFSAPSGSGKTTIVREILARMDKLEFSVSATTRPMRENEINGRDYFFLSVEDFKEKINANEFLEWEEVYPGRFYGTLKSEVDRIRNEGNSAVFDVDVVGGINIKQHYNHEALSFFIQAPSIEVLRERLVKRGTDSMEDTEIRVQKAESEMQYRNQFDETIVNDDLERAIDEVAQKIESFTSR